jgi:hypothetical protein
MYIVNIHIVRRRDPMEANIVDLRYRMKDVLKALSRNEKVRILYHGKVKGVIVPVEQKGTGSVRDHPFFGMYGDDDRPVGDIMDKLRGDRYRDI